MTRTRYYVGLTMRNGLPVTPEVQDKVTATVAAAYGGGCTVYSAVGYWEGVREQSMVLEALAPSLDKAPVPEVLAGVLAQLAEQSSVLWTSERIAGGFAP